MLAVLEPANTNNLDIALPNTRTLVGTTGSIYVGEPSVPGEISTTITAQTYFQ